MLSTQLDFLHVRQSRQNGLAIMDHSDPLHSKIREIKQDHLSLNQTLAARTQKGQKTKLEANGDT